MNGTTAKDRNDEAKKKDEELDDALEDTFPASDPIEQEQPGGDKPRSSKVPRR